MTDELRELDREWAELAGWEIEDIFDSRSTMRVTYWKYDHLMLPIEPRFSRVASECFGIGGPWEWLDDFTRAAPDRSVVIVGADDSYMCLLVEDDATIAEYDGPILMAITRCAIEARKKVGSLEARDPQKLEEK